MYQQIQDYAEETRHYGLVVVIWSYPHGSGVSKPGETAIDITGYAAHIAAQIGAHILRNKHLITPVFLVGAHGRAPLPAKKLSVLFTSRSLKSSCLVIMWSRWLPARSMNKKPYRSPR